MAIQKFTEFKTKDRILIESLDYNGIGVDIVDQDYNILYYNSTLKERFGNPNREKCYEHYLQVDTPCKNCPMRKAIKNNRTEQEIISTSDNKVYKIISAPLLNENGKLDRAIEIIIDLTDRIESEGKFRETEVKFRNLSNELETLLDIIPGMIFCKDKDGVVLRTNKLFAESLNLEKSEIIGKTASDLFPKDQAESFQRDDLEVLKSEKPKLNIEESADFPDGKIWAITNKVPYYDKDGNVNGIIGLFVDITKRKKTEQKLKESEEKYRILIEQSLQGITIMQDMKLVFANPAIARIVGYSVEELLSFSAEEVFNLIHPDDRTFVMNRHIARMEGKQVPNHYIYHIIRKDNVVRTIELYATVIEYERKIASQQVFIDITESKETERKLKELSKIKSELLSRTSHELKTPAMHIKGYADLLLLNYKNTLGSDEFQIIKNIKKGVLRLETLIYDILHKAELDSGYGEFNKVQSDLSSLIDLSVRELKSFATLRGHSIKLDIHDSLKINFDNEQIRHVLNNLITNAIKYTPLNGIIRISSTITDDFITIAIQDNGIGLTEEHISRLFTQFGKIERYGQGYDIIPDGTGLGLHIAKKIIDLHGGKIWVESGGINKGSTFYFSLPKFNI